MNAIVLQRCKKELEQLTEELRKDLYQALDKLEQSVKLSMPLSRSLPQVHLSLHELRLKDFSGANRIIYYIKTSEAIYLLHAFKKKTEQMPKKNVAVILKRLKEIK